MVRWSASLLSVATLCLIAACGGPSAAATAAAHKPTHVDSIIPREEALRRFQASAHRVDSLSGGASSRDDLVRTFLRALAHSDTATLRGLAIDRNEFAFLYYPTAPQGLPPYDLAPELFWFTLESGTDKGLSRALESRGGRPLEFQAYRCDSIPSHEGENTVWGPCSVRYRRDGKVADERLFGLIMERDGRFKFVSYANRL